MKIKNKVKDCKTISQEEFLKLTPNTLKDENRDVTKLKNSIRNTHFTFPAFIWKDYIIDGAGRQKAVKEMIAEGDTFDEIPVVYIEAKDLNEVKQQVLAASSQYGTITIASVIKFADDLEIDFDSIQIQGIDKNFIIGQPIDNPAHEWVGMPEVNSQKIEGAIRSIIIHFEKEEDVRDFINATELRITDKTRFIWFPQREREDIKATIIKSEDTIEM